MTTQPGENRFKNNIVSTLSPITAPTLRTPPTPYIVVGILLAIAAAFAVNFTSNISPVLIIGAAAALFVAISVFQKPELGAYILIFSVFTNLSDLFTEKGLPSINKPLVALVVLSIFANHILRTGKISALPKINSLDFTLMLYLLTTVGSSFVAIDQSKAFSTVFDLFKDVVVGYCIYITLDSREKIKTGIKIFLVAITFMSVLGVFRNLSGTSNNFWGFAQLSAFGQVSDTDGQLRYAGPLGESNIWGQVLVSAIPIILYTITKQSVPTKRIIPAISGLFILLAMVITESRGAFVAFVLILILIAFDLRIKSTTFLAFTTIILIILAILPDKYSQRFKSLDILFQNQEYSYTQDESITDRRSKYLIGIAMFIDHPFLGVGISNYPDNYWEYAGAMGLESSNLTGDTKTEIDAQKPHSLYLEIMSETGLFGITTFLTFLGLAIYRLYQSRKQIKQQTASETNKEWSMLTVSVMMSLITFLIAGFFLHGIGFRFIWVLIGIALAFIRFGLKQLPTPNAPAT